MTTYMILNLNDLDCRRWAQGKLSDEDMGRKNLRTTTLHAGEERIHVAIPDNATDAEAGAALSAAWRTFLDASY